MYFVYIIYAKAHDKYYRGFSQDPYKRLKQHNNGESKYTSKYTPWELVFIQKFDSKEKALMREKSLKKYSKAQILSLINTPLNIL